LKNKIKNHKTLTKGLKKKTKRITLKIIIYERSELIINLEINKTVIKETRKKKELKLKY